MGVQHGRNVLSLPVIGRSLGLGSDFAAVGGPPTAPRGDGRGGGPGDGDHDGDRSGGGPDTSSP